MKRILIMFVVAFLLSSCELLGYSKVDVEEFKKDAEEATGAAQKVADQIVEIPAQYRGLRVCLFATMMVELGTDKVRLLEPTLVNEVRGRLEALQGAAEAARDVDPLWINTDMANITFTFARVVFATSRERARGYLKRGLSINAVLIGARTVAAQTLKGGAMLQDVNAMVAGLVAGTYTEPQIWTACLTRMEKNRKTLNVLAGMGS